MTTTEPATFLEFFVAALVGSTAYNKNDQVPPAAILWTDKERQWQPLLPLLRPQLPLLTLGDYNPDQRTGPAYYLRCMLARTLDDKLPEDAIPILYLPGYSRQELRTVEDCPKPIQPLASLQYSGVFFSHKNGRDWTIAGFLRSTEGGLGIPVSADSATKEAMQRALLKLVHEPVAHLRHVAPLKAAFFNSLLNPDEVRRLLKWLDDPEGYPPQLSQQEWDAFCALCRSKYGFHPQKDGPITAAEKLGERYGPWAAVWERFEEAPDAYPHLPDLLDKAHPQPSLFGEPAPTWPTDNAIAEDRLRQALAGLDDTPRHQARQTITALEAEHGQRRSWVWAKLDQSPLARALQHLHKLAQVTEKSLQGTSVDVIAGRYAEWGWEADAAVVEALQAVDRAEDVAAVKAAIVSLYRPWLEDAARAFQQAVALASTEVSTPHPLPEPDPGVCILFCDALRFDAGKSLQTLLEQQGLHAEMAWRMAALPPVTPTAKPAVSPVADRIAGNGKLDLIPVVSETGSDITAATLRNLLSKAGYQILADDELGDPGGKAWTEFGAIDAYGHEHGWKIAHHLIDELERLAERVLALTQHGWRQVRIVTDHGWLMLPGGLPKAELPLHLTHLRKGRCAVLKLDSDTGQQTAPWHWDDAVRIALAPGIRCYEAGKEYEHGGLSPQECVTPTLSVSPAGGASTKTVAIKHISWKRLRCTVELVGFSPTGPGLLLDIRTKAGDPTTSLVNAPRPVEGDGQASVLVVDEDMEGAQALVVILDPRGVIQAQAATTIGD